MQTTKACALAATLNRTQQTAKANALAATLGRVQTTKANALTTPQSEVWAHIGFSFYKTKPWDQFSNVPYQ